MAKAIPEDIANIVWNLYMTEGGLSMRQIGEQVGISKTSVYNIVSKKEKKDPIFPLMRTLIEDLHKNGTTLREYADIIRIFNVLEEYKIEPTVAERMIKTILLTCYQENWEPSEAIKTMNMIANSAVRYGKNIKEHAQYYLELQEKIKMQVKALSDVIHANQVIKDNLELFKSEGGIQNWITDKKLNYSIESENMALKKDLQLYRAGKSVDPFELKKLNERLLHPLSEDNILNKLDDVRRHPSDYVDLFDNLMRAVVDEI